MRQQFPARSSANLLIAVLAWSIGAAASWAQTGQAPGQQAPGQLPDRLSPASAACVDCHKAASPGIYQQWGGSKHFRGNVGCFECHGSKRGEPGAMEHNGYSIHVVVTPFDCARCHPKEHAEFANSHHAKGGEILGSLDNTLAEVVEGNTAFFGGSALLVNGCRQCHGSTVKTDKDGKPTPDTWPNTGIGRINLDGSRGSCSACHQRHTFSAAQARQPETCGKCHLGPDHPQKEIYEESKHGISYFANAQSLRLESPKWVVGEDYSVGPTCATCHMSATPAQPVTHDVGLRISWNNRPAVSVRPETADLQLGLKNPAPWQKRRENMEDVCANCHSPSFAASFYTQYDGLVELYNEKFGKPGSAIFAALQKNGLIGDVPFANKIEWTWYEIWHHQGRRARHGASMQAPDYTHWNGLYEVAKAFYTEYIPQAQEIVSRAIAAGGPQAASAKSVQQLIEATLASDNHRWFIGQMTPEEKAERKRQQDEFKKRYAAPP